MGVIAVKGSREGKETVGETTIFRGPAIVIIIPAIINKAVLAAHAVHDPRSSFHAIKLQGQGQGEQVHVVKPVVLVIGVNIVVIDRACPEGGQANIIIKLIGAYHGSHVSIHNGRTASLVGQGQALDTHTHLEVRGRGRPVDIGTSYLNDSAVSTQGTAIRCFTPVGIPDFKIDSTGQGFGGHGIQLQTHTLESLKIIARTNLFPVSTITCFAYQIAISNTKTNPPRPLGVKINGTGTGGGTQQHGSSQHDGTNLFHCLPSFLHKKLSSLQKRYK